jgi:hypothetical protein
MEVWASESLYFGEQITFDAILKKIQKQLDESQVGGMRLLPMTGAK